MSVRLYARRRESQAPWAPYLHEYPVDWIDRPAPAIAAHGLSSCSHGQFWLEDDGVSAPAAPAPGLAKPPYAIPPLAEIAALPWNGLNVVSTFAGCGGSSTGYRMAGYRVRAAVEVVPAAQESYALNMGPHTRLVRKDVRDLEADELLELAGLERGELDVFDGSPPCEPFSTAGRRDKTWRQVVAYSGQRQRTDDLFFEYARLVDGLRPRCFVAENVEGLVKGRAKGYFLWILARLRELGYRVQARVLNAAWLGVPQNRKRVIFIGVREGLDAHPVFPIPWPFQFTVRDALPHIARVGTDPNFDRRRRDKLTVDQMMVDADRPAPTVQCSPSGVRTPGASGANGLVDAESGEIVGYRRDTGNEGCDSERDRLDEPAPTITGPKTSTHHMLDVYDEQIVGNDAFEPVFGSVDQPSPTIMAGGARTSGELRDSRTLRRRTFTIAELKRISGFPDDYRLHGSFAHQWERMGDCVPPPMMRAIAEVLRDGPLAPFVTDRDAA